MNSIKKTSRIDTRVILSALWVFLTVNYIYCDHLVIMEPEIFKDLMTGHIGTIQITQGILLVTAVSMQIPFAMIVLSLVLKYRANRWANIIAGIILIAVQLGTMNTGTPPTLVYIFFSIIEIVCILLIVLVAWKWRKQED